MQYLLDPRTIKPYNPHWRPIADICRPCQIQYDVIGKYETLNDDSWLLLQKANLSSRIQFPHTKPSTRRHLVKEAFETLTDDQLLQVHKIFEHDFDLFGYDPSPYTRTSQPGESSL